jgi:hypothetical protein
MKQNVLAIWNGLMQNPLPVTRQSKLVKAKNPAVVHKVIVPLGMGVINLYKQIFLGLPSALK